MLANGELCSVNGKWERTCQTRVAAPRREAKSPEATDQNAILLLDPSCPGLAPEARTTPLRANSLTLLSDLWGPEERQRSDGLLGKVRQPRAKTSKSRGVANNPKTEDMGRESLVLSLFSACLLRFQDPFLSSTQIRAVRLFRAGSEGHDLSSTVTNDPIAPSPPLRQLCLPNHEELVATSAPLADRFGAGLIAGRRARLELTVHRVRLCAWI